MPTNLHTLPVHGDDARRRRRHTADTPQAHLLEHRAGEVVLAAPLLVRGHDLLDAVRVDDHVRGVAFRGRRGAGDEVLHHQADVFGFFLVRVQAGKRGEGPVQVDLLVVWVQEVLVAVVEAGAFAAAAAAGAERGVADLGFEEGEALAGAGAGGGDAVAGLDAAAAG